MHQSHVRLIHSHKPEASPHYLDLHFKLVSISNVCLLQFLSSSAITTIPQIQLAAWSASLCVSLRVSLNRTWLHYCTESSCPWQWWPVLFGYRRRECWNVLLRKSFSNIIIHNDCVCAGKINCSGTGLSGDCTGIPHFSLSSPVCLKVTDVCWDSLH